MNEPIIKIQDFLLRHDVKPNLKGFGLLTDMIATYTPDRKLTGDLYVEVGKKMKMSGSCVERGIRHAINCSSLKKDSGQKTNGQVIAWCKLMIERE